MTPKMSPMTSRVVLLLSAVDFVADKISPIPSATRLYLNSPLSEARLTTFHNGMMKTYK